MSILKEVARQVENSLNFAYPFLEGKFRRVRIVYFNPINDYVMQAFAVGIYKPSKNEIAKYSIPTESLDFNLKLNLVGELIHSFDFTATSSDGSFTFSLETKIKEALKSVMANLKSKGVLRDYSLNYTILAKKYLLSQAAGLYDVPDYVREMYGLNHKELRGQLRALFDSNFRLVRYKFSCLVDGQEKFAEW